MSENEATLTARAPRPTVVRVRRSVALVAAAGACTVIACALGWAFIGAPQLRAMERTKAAREIQDKGAVAARPSEAILAQPAAYDRLPAQLPEPRQARSSPPNQPGTASRPRVSPPRRTMRADLVEQATSSNLFFAAPAPASDRRRPPPVEPLPAPPSAPATFELQAGTIIPATLASAIDSSRPGIVLALVARPIHDSATGRRLLIPQGARLLGRLGESARHADRRAYVQWEKLLLPNGASIPMNGAQAVDPSGAVGVSGRTDRRLGSLSIGLLLSGVITALGQAARDSDGDEGGLAADAGNAAAIEAAQLGGRLIDRELDLPPVIRLEPGAPILALLADKMSLPVYTP